MLCVPPALLCAAQWKANSRFLAYSKHSFLQHRFLILRVYQCYYNGLCLCARQEGIRGSVGMAGVILDLGTRQGRGRGGAVVVSFIPGAPGYRLIGCRVRSRTSLNTFRKNKMSCPCRQSNHDFLGVQPVAQLLDRPHQCSCCLSGADNLLRKQK